MAQNIQTGSTRENQTELDQTITGIPWRKGFDYGVGIDAITGSLSGTAIKKFTPSNPWERLSTERYRFIQSESDLNQEIEASASGKYNIEGVKVSASTQFLHKIKFSDLSTTLIAEYESRQNGYDQAESYELTDEAQWLMGDEPAAFRKSYGDYFIAGGLRRSRFLALYRCQASSAESMMSFKASLGAGVPNVFSAQASSKFMRAASQSNVSISIDIALEGYEGQAPSGPWTPQKVLEALDWFKGAEKGVHLEALLKHYSTIDPTYLRTIPIAPSVFMELRQLYLKVWDIRSFYAPLPQHYQDQLRKDYTDLDTGVPAYQGQLPTDQTSRKGYQQRADNLLGRLMKMRTRQDFTTMVRAQAAKEPGRGAEIVAGAGQNQWMYGLNSYPRNEAVSDEIESKEMHYAESWRIGWREHTFEFGPDSRYLIVGWQVISNWTDGTNGSWWKETDQILGRHHAAVHVKSQYDRGCDWGLRVYYVEAKDYQF
jgi:hypothetical protein